ncbi:unnamed protein product [Psylliodes chrysocephalus]|uniref:V(D)J recombination-activating protein 1 RNase H domain-containing protein n=1 Tax=Psylliodes chrysocephalus TaxID=3402493 RepID=A0A9P0CZ51_9CUCU|nr:unnamed protein product [Psylliodes chrysocephala]
METSAAGPIYSTVAISRRELYDILTNSGQSKINDQFKILISYLKERTGCPDTNLKDINSKTYHFKSEFKSRWLNVGKSRNRAKFRHTDEFKGIRKYRGFQIIKRHNSTSPKRASKYRKAYKTSIEKEPRQMSGEDALALLVDAKLSRHQYSLIRQSNPGRFPSYKILQAEKTKCYPNNIKVSKTFAKVLLQDLFNHTVERLISVQESVISSLNNEQVEKLQLMTKWGFHGSSGHSSYKQAFHGFQASDSSVFITSIVPLRLVCNPDSNNSKIVWQNPRPSSTRYCRPLKIAFIKESSEVSVAEKNRVDTEIQQLQNSKLNSNSRSISVSHNMIFAMIDGKICNALTETTSTQTCYICGATTKDFNDIDKMINRKITTQNLQFGISILHGWIRFLSVSIFPINSQLKSGKREVKIRL